MKKKFLSILLCMCMIAVMLPSAAFAAENIVATDSNGNTYTSLADAVEAAAVGSTITLNADDTARQSIEIAKDLTININGYNLPKTVFAITAGHVNLSDSKGTGSINSDRAVGFNVEDLDLDAGFSIRRRVTATVIASGSAKVSLNNITIYSDGGSDLTKCVYLGGSQEEGTSLTINNANLLAVAEAGCDSLYFYNDEGSTLTINSMFASGILSVNQYPDTTKLIIKNANIDSPRGALWVESGSSGSSTSGFIRTEEDASRFLSAGSYFIIPEGEEFDYRKIVVGSDLFVSEGFTAPENGSDDPMQEFPKNIRTDAKTAAHYKR